MKKRLILILLLVLFSSQSAYAYWIWTPESKKWTNPKNAPKESPQEQLKFALGYFEIKDYETAYNEFKKLVRYYPDALEAPEAQFYMGRCLEETNKLYEAFQAYQKVVDKYPFTDRTDEVFQQEYIVAQKLLDYRKNFAGINFTGELAALEVFRKIVENAPYGKYAAASQYKIGLTLKAKGDFTDATAEFQKVLDNYPASEWAEPAKFQIAVCAGRSSLGASYDQTMTQEAVERFKTFLATHPDAELSDQAQVRIEELRDKEAQSNFEIGQFYEKQKAFDSARIYYQFVIADYPRSLWAQKSLERIQALEKKKT
jgi:outer membrane protein assembly factor BamD